MRTVFAQPNVASAREQWRRVSDGIYAHFPRIGLADGEAERNVMPYATFPAEHMQKV